ncbi:hypothetical protein ACSQ67_010519 [Phaseolus vulgaris]
MDGKIKEEQEQDEVHQVTGLVQAIRPESKQVCKGRSWLLAVGVKIMDPRNSTIKENCSVTIVVSMVILQLNVEELITSNNIGKLSKKDEAHIAQEDEDSNLNQELLMATTNRDEDASSWYLDTRPFQSYDRQ